MAAPRGAARARWLAAAALVCLAGAGCGGTATSAPVAAAPAAMEMPGDDPHAEIRRLWADIDRLQGDGLMTRGASDVAVAGEAAAAGAEADGERVSTLREPAPLCRDEPAPATPRCGDSCRIGRAICDNAAAICRIAASLQGDVWAEERCDAAEGACRDATETCCACIHGE
jgi:hypothetical protein